MSTLKIGDEVTLPQGQKAVLKWIGHIAGRQPAEFAGVEVLGPDAELYGKHSGVYQGQQIFETTRPNTGLFLSYTQLLSYNIKPPRYSPTSSRGSQIEPNYFGSPTRLKGSSSLTTSGTTSRAGSPIKELSPLADSSAKQQQQQRQFFRDAMAAANLKLADLTLAFDTKVEAMRKDFDAQLKRARRSSVMYTVDSEVEEQRIALAAMQNKLINERTEKQEEIDKLKNELFHMRKLAGSVEDLESLISELENSESQLAQLRTQVNDMDELKKQLSEAMQHSVELELELQSTKSKLKEANAHPDRAETRSPKKDLDTVPREEHERLEKLLESKLLRESELEAENEALQQKVKDLEKITESIASAKNSDTIDKHLVADTTIPRDMSMLDAIPDPVPDTVPVPGKLVSYDDSMDIAAGRSDWCSLCERQGHVTTECPF